MWEVTPQERAVQIALDRGQAMSGHTTPMLPAPVTQPLIEYKPIELAPVVMSNGSESVFKGSGTSHFSYEVGKGFHVTTEIPGLRQGQRINVQDDLY